MRADYHLHTRLCGHAEGEMEEYVRRGAEQGVKVMGFSDHLPLGPDLEHHHTMDPEEMRFYAAEVERLRSKYPGIEILLAGEIGLYPGFEHDLAEMRSAFPLDYVIGSVHYFGSLFVFSKEPVNPDVIDVEEEIETYFSLYAMGVESGLIDIMGHIDGIKWLFAEDRGKAGRGMEDLLKKIAAGGAVMEVNTSGLRKRPEECYPSERIITRAAELGIPVCTGSDAHLPEQVGMDFSEAEAVLKRCGYSQSSDDVRGLHVWRPEHAE